VSQKKNSVSVSSDRGLVNGRGGGGCGGQNASSCVLRGGGVNGVLIPPSRVRAREGRQRT